MPPGGERADAAGQLAARAAGGPAGAKQPLPGRTGHPRAAGTAHPQHQDDPRQRPGVVLVLAARGYGRFLAMTIRWTWFVPS
ncbi:hypothetical protein BSL84_13075 [Streptomyces sp. TN58]|nr:hypothetical protein BSL84_13075 [Streptomyces sp. TN58]